MHIYKLRTCTACERSSPSRTPLYFYRMVISLTIHPYAYDVDCIFFFFFVGPLKIVKLYKKKFRKPEKIPKCVRIVVPIAVILARWQSCKFVSISG